VWETIAAAAAAESPLWAEALLERDGRHISSVFSELAPPELALGVETIYEGYLVHYGESRLFAPKDDDTALLLGDYLYAHGLVRVAQTGNVGAVADLSELIALCAQLRAEGRSGDGAAWAATCARLGQGGLDGARDTLRLTGDPQALDHAARTAGGAKNVERALETHGALVG
jgi:hypothetical protein